MPLTLGANCIMEQDPEVVQVDPSRFADLRLYSVRRLQGCWWRVFPTTPSDVSFLRLLEHHVEKFCPSEGGGTIIKCVPPCRCRNDLDFQD